MYFAGHTFQCKILISCRDKIWPTLWCIFVHSDSMSLSLSHLLTAFSVSIFYCLLYSDNCPSCYAFLSFFLWMFVLCFLLYFPNRWSVFRIRIGSGFKQVIGSAFGIQIRIQMDTNDPQKQEKVKNFHVLKCWMVSFGGWRLLL